MSVVIDSDSNNTSLAPEPDMEADQEEIAGEEVEDLEEGRKLEEQEVDDKVEGDLESNRQEVGLEEDIEAYLEESEEDDEEEVEVFKVIDMYPGEEGKDTVEVEEKKEVVEEKKLGPSIPYRWVATKMA